MRVLLVPYLHARPAVHWQAAQQRKPAAVLDVLAHGPQYRPQRGQVKVLGDGLEVLGVAQQGGRGQITGWA